jgi:2-dehydropantoate 2-reductase
VRYIVFGAGAIGSIVGAYLRLAGHDTVLVARPGHVAQIREHGLLVRSPSETHRVAIEAVSSANDLRPFRDDDVVLLTVKSQHTESALRELEPAGMPLQTPLFCCQNAVVNEPLAARRLANVYGVLVIMPAIYVTDGEVVAADRGNAGLLEFGRYPVGTDDLVRSVTSDLQEAGFRVGENANIMRTKYTKLVANLGNALLAVVGVNASPDEQDALYADIRAEALRIFDRAGIDYEPWDAFNARSMPLVADSKLPAGVPYGGSTWLSLVRKSGSVETDYLNGEIVRLGRASGVLTPLNDALCRVVKDMAQRGLEPGTYSVADLRRLGAGSMGAVEAAVERKE